MLPCCLRLQVCALEDVVDPQIVAAAKTPDAAIMTTTEWLVKTAGGFVLQLRRAGHTAKCVCHLHRLRV